MKDLLITTVWKIFGVVLPIAAADHFLSTDRQKIAVGALICAANLVGMFESDRD